MRRWITRGEKVARTKFSNTNLILNLAQNLIEKILNFIAFFGNCVFEIFPLAIQCVIVFSCIYFYYRGLCLLIICFRTRYQLSLTIFNYHDTVKVIVIRNFNAKDGHPMIEWGSGWLPNKFIDEMCLYVPFSKVHSVAIL